MSNELVEIERSTALDLFKAATKAQELVNYVSGEVAKELVELEKLDLSVGVNRNKYISLAAKVTKTKTYVEGIGKEIAAELKEIPRLVDQSRKLIKDQLDNLSEEVRRPVTDWEIADDARKAAEELARKMPELHDDALQMNELLDLKIEKASRERLEHEEEIKRQAVEQARIEVEQKAQQEREAAELKAKQLAEEAASRERQLKEQAELAEREKLEAIKRAEQAAKDAEIRAQNEKRQAIAAEQKKAADAERARLAEVKRLADEEVRRQANKEHRMVINNKVMQDFINAGIPDDCAKACVSALAKNLIGDARIIY